jgi:hypothetical protein
MVNSAVGASEEKVYSWNLYLPLIFPGLVTVDAFGCLYLPVLNLLLDKVTLSCRYMPLCITEPHCRC